MPGWPGGRAQSPVFRRLVLRLMGARRAQPAAGCRECDLMGFCGMIDVTRRSGREARGMRQCQLLGRLLSSVAI